MREALGLLAAWNPVRVDRGRGCQVTSLSLKALASLTSARNIIEDGVRLSVEQGGLA